MKSILFMGLLLIAPCIQALHIDRVIIASDANPMYLPFWPIVAKTWKQLVGVQPTLFLVAPANVVVDETLGEVIRFEPIEGIPTSFQAQVIRLLAPAYFEDEVCIISDMDMIPLSKEYFAKSVKDIPDDCFVTFKDGAFAGQDMCEYPMCYNVAKGSIFKEIFNVDSVHQIPEIIKQWYALGLGWTTDQQILYHTLNRWHAQTGRLVKLGHHVDKRVDRGWWGYDAQLVSSGYYTDCHMLRPYDYYEQQLNELVHLLGIE
ncbi:MAG: hypothetical protein ACOYT8_00175 [Candidatus Dependentiae bacterium]